MGGLLECWSLNFTGYFAFGVLLRVWPAIRRGPALCALMLCGAALLACQQRAAGLLLLIPSAAVWIGNQSWPVFRSAARWGDLSLGIFLWAWPVGQVVRLVMPGHAPSLSRFAVVVVLALGMAWLSSRCIEMPALRRKPARPAARFSAPAPALASTGSLQTSG
jgi:peptidoglycan/LPS O-acetylase OafA/YrhL